MQRRRFKHILTFPERLEKEAEALKDKAREMPPGIERETLLRKARQVKTALEVNAWLSSPDFGRPSEVRPLKDYLAQLEKLRSDAAECALIRDLATDKAKREMFDRLAAHLGALADQVEQAMLERKTGIGK